MRKSKSILRAELFQGLLAAIFCLISFQNFSDKATSTLDSGSQNESANVNSLKCLVGGCVTDVAVTDDSGEIVGYISPVSRKMALQGKDSDLSHTVGSIFHAVDPQTEKELALAAAEKESQKTPVDAEPDGFKTKTDIAIDN